MRLRREILKSYYDHVPFVINSGYAHHAAFLARQAPTIRRKAQDGCQNGQLWLSAFIRMAPTES